jgi:hypothetical protein
LQAQQPLLRPIQVAPVMEFSSSEKKFVVGDELRNPSL